MSDMDDLRVLANRIDDHNWWLGELEQYGMPQAYVEYFMAVKPSTVMDTFGSSDDMQYEIDELSRQVDDLEWENRDLETANDDLTEEVEELRAENSRLQQRVWELDDAVEKLGDEIYTLEAVIEAHNEYTE